MASISQKICLIGDFGVGKTSLVRRYVDNQFDDFYKSTIGVKISIKTFEVVVKDRPKQVKLLVWDIEGQTRFKAIAPSYLAGAKGVVIVADVNRPASIEHIWDHINLFQKINPRGLAIVAFNKADLATPERLNSILKNYPFSNVPNTIAAYMTSAKNGDRVNEIFYKLSISILENS